MDIMTEPQSWVLIGLFTTIMLGGMSIMTILINRSIDSLRLEMTGRIDGLSGEMNGRIDGLSGEMNGRIDGLRGEMNSRFDAMNVRMDSLDKDVAALVKRVMG
ncbi:MULTISPECIES: hypothetical protein [Microbacterium]|nr:hypothetical protein [Microbacterium aquimaris]